MCAFNRALRARRVIRVRKGLFKITLLPEGGLETFGDRLTVALRTDLLRKPSEEVRTNLHAVNTDQCRDGVTYTEYIVCVGQSSPKERLQLESDWPVVAQDPLTSGLELFRGEKPLDVDIDLYFRWEANTGLLAQPPDVATGTGVAQDEANLVSERGDGLVLAPEVR